MDIFWSCAQLEIGKGKYQLCVYCQSEMWHSNVEMRLDFFVCGESHGLSESLGGGGGGLLKEVQG